MCGILGGISEVPLSVDRLSEASISLRHRGPDDAGLFTDGKAFLGIRRLAIIDVDGGKQPISNETGTITAVLNGEIYNYRELTRLLTQRGHVFATRSDTEVLVHAYEEWGEDFVRELRGMFAFGLWDKKRQLMLLARDRFGKKPLYYVEPATGGILFASEIKALRCLAESEKWAIRPESIYDYLSLLTIPQPNTVYRNVFTLPEASVGIYARRSFQIKRYWNLPEEQNPALDYEESKRAIREAIREAVTLRLASEVPLGVFLSGGMDSTIIAYEAAQVLGSRLRTFTVAVADSDLNEGPMAARTAQSLGVRNDLIELQMNPVDLLDRLVPHFDQPFADASAIPSYAVARKAREFVTVVLNGDGGDEMFGGYRRYVAAGLLDRIPLMQVAGRFGGERLLLQLTRNRRNLAGFVHRLMRGTRSPPGEKYLTWTTDTLLEREKRQLWLGAPVRSTESWIEEILPEAKSALRTQMLGDQKIILPGLLVKMDMATMLASVEARSPLLDHKLAELAASFPDDFLVRRTRAKAILRDAYADVLPKEVLTGKKRGFEIPLQRWLETDLQEMLHDLVGAPTARIAEFLDSKGIQKILHADILRDRNRSYLLYSLLVLELWLRSTRTAVQAPELAAA